jgi:hypothetical protein
VVEGVKGALPHVAARLDVPDLPDAVDATRRGADRQGAGGAVLQDVEVVTKIKHETYVPINM